MFLMKQIVQRRQPSTELEKSISVNDVHNDGILISSDDEEQG